MHTEQKDKLKELLKRHEGLKLKPYRDPEGILTIGYGRNLEEVGISREEAEILLENDMERAIWECEKLDFWGDLDEVRQVVIAEMMFNLGMRKFLGFKRMIAAIREGDYYRAAYEMRDSKWCRQVGSRCEELARIMETGRYEVD